VAYFPSTVRAGTTGPLSKGPSGGTSNWGLLALTGPLGRVTCGFACHVTVRKLAGCLSLWFRWGAVFVEHHQAPPWDQAPQQNPAQQQHQAPPWNQAEHALPPDQCRDDELRCVSCGKTDRETEFSRAQTERNHRRSARVGDGRSIVCAVGVPLFGWLAGTGEVPTKQYEAVRRRQDDA